MNVYSASLKGKRLKNEDKHVIILNANKQMRKLLPINLFAVFDGHGGDHVSSYLADNLPLQLMTSNVFPFNKKYVYGVFDKIQNELIADKKKRAQYCGSTCLTIIHYKMENTNFINVYNVGDCRAILCRDSLAIALTKDHKPMWPEEKRRIEQMGGIIKTSPNDDPRICDLSVSRAFGDIDATPYVTHVPQPYKYKLEKNDKFMVIGCDGLYDVLSNQDIVNFILNEYYNSSFDKINAKSDIAKKLAEYAINKGSQDNVSVIVVLF